MDNLSPYWDLNFFQFFQTLFVRSFQALCGVKQSLATDEIQLIVLLLLSIPSALLGVFMNLRKMTMLANSLSHTVLIGLIAAFLVIPNTIQQGALSLSTLFVASIFSAFVTVSITEGAVKGFRLQKDASIGLVFTGLFSLGIILVTLFSKNTHLGTEIIMGNIDALHFQDVKSGIIVCLVNLFFLLIFFKELYYTTFDAVHTKLLGLKPALFHYLLIFLLAATSIAAFRAMGIVLFLAFLTTPFLIMRLFSCKIIGLFVGSVVIAALASSMGVASSRHLLSVYNMPLSTSGLVVTWMALFYLVAQGIDYLLHTRRKKSWRRLCEK